MRFKNTEYQRKLFACVMLVQDENKEIALGTSKLNYLDPRITIAW